MANILIYSSNPIGKAMAGPAIRVWEFAKALSKHHKVVIVTPNQSDVKPETFTLIYNRDPLLKKIRPTADIMITQTLTIRQAMLAKHYQTRIILDAYDPLPLEVLEIFKNHSTSEKNKSFNSVMTNFIFSFKMADSIICASEKQRDLWLGFLLNLKRINPQIYDQDTSLRNLVDVVPFGLSNQPPQINGPGLRELYNFSPTDKIILWGGGIWNWFDPLTLIKAMKLISQTNPEIKLVFMGIKHPDPAVPEMEMCTQAIQLSKDLELLDKSVFVNYGWVPYNERQNFLLQADIGVSTHFDHLETRFSFRTRMLDYIWAKLPILATVGDSFADLIHQHNLGIVVPYRSEKAIAGAILSLIDNPEKISKIKKSLEEMQSQFYWNTVVEPIERMIKQFDGVKKPSWSFENLCAYSRYARYQVADKGLWNCIKKVFKVGK